MKRNSRLVVASYVRNFVFGVEDSLVSTVGLLAGIAAGGVNKTEIILTGIVLVFVEAFSMGVGSFLSEESAEEYMNKKDAPIGTTIANGSIMFVSYFLSGIIPLFPYVLFEQRTAVWVSISLSLIALALLGLVSGKLFRVNYLGNGIRMLVMGGLAILVGMLVGSYVRVL